MGIKATIYVNCLPISPVCVGCSSKIVGSKDAVEA